MKEHNWRTRLVDSFATRPVTAESISLSIRIRDYKQLSAGNAPLLFSAWWERGDDLTVDEINRLADYSRGKIDRKPELPGPGTLQADEGEKTRSKL